MENKPIFTVIMPTYNRKSYLKRSVDSILSQTFENFELIIVDDGSTDGTESLVKTFGDDRVIYLYKENGGHNSARNMALKNARGEYIAFCDSDDCWLPEKLEKHIQKYHSDNEVKVVYDLTGTMVMENGASQIVVERNDTCEGWCYKEVLRQGYLTSPTFLSCKKECFDKIGGLTMELTNCEDDDLCFQLCKHFKVGLVKEVLGIRYTDADNRITMNWKLCADDYFKFLEKWKDEIVKMCGTDVLRSKYNRAAKYYVEINEIDRAGEIYEMACKAGNSSAEEIKSRIKGKLFINDEIIIYGTGDWGEKIYYVLKIAGFDNFRFAVTDTKKTGKNWHGREVEEIGTLDAKIKVPLIIASSKYYDEMRSIAMEKGFIHIFSYKEVFDLIFS